MREEPNRDYLHAKVVMALRRLIDTQYPEGGWLPSVRDMAVRLGVNPRTYTKALQCLVDESLARSFPKRGHYVAPTWLRLRKVGLVLSDGSESPFFHGGACVSDAAGLLHARGFHTHLIQGVSPARLHDNAVLHGVDGLLWLDPAPKAAEAIATIAAADSLPLVVAHINHFFTIPGVCELRRDEGYELRVQAEAMLARGHRRVAYQGQFQRALDGGLVAALAAAGIELPPALCVPGLSGEPGKMSKLVRLHGVAAVIAGGGELELAMLFEELAALPPPRPEVLAFRFPSLPAICQRFPDVKCVALGMRYPCTLGRLAAEMLADHLLKGTPLRSTKLRLVPDTMKPCGGEPCF